MPVVPPLTDLLAAYGIRPSALRVTALPGGEDNLNLRLDVAGRTLVLRRYDITPADEVAFELELVARLADRRFPTPGPLRRLDGGLATPLEGRPAALFPFASGRHPTGDPLWAGEAVAAALADLHLLTADFPRPSVPRSRTDANRLMGLLAVLQGRRAPAFAPVAAAIRRCLAERTATAAALPAAVVHHDAHGGNVLFDAEGRLTALLDFDEAYPDVAMTDVARLLFHWARTPDGLDLDRARAGALLAAYRARRAPTPAERAALPHALRFATLADAADYLTGLLREDPRAASPDGCHSWALYRRLEAAG